MFSQALRSRRGSHISRYREVADTLLEYDLLKDDADAVAELAVWPGRADPAQKIAPKVYGSSKLISRRRPV